MLQYLFDFFFYSFSYHVPKIFSPLRSSITYIQGLYLTFLITKTSSDKFEEQTFAKTFLDFDILTWLPTLKLGSSSLFSLPKPIYVLDLLSASYILIVL